MIHLREIKLILDTSDLDNLVKTISNLAKKIDANQDELNLFIKQVKYEVLSDDFKKQILKEFRKIVRTELREIKEELIANR